MRKFLILFVLILLSSNSCNAWFWSKSSSTSATTEIEAPSRGYVGNLPDISKGDTSLESKTTKPNIEKTKNFNSAKEIKPIPRENPAFVNIILKEDKNSQYINDINELLPQLENILLCIENSSNVQMFNAKVYFFNKTVEYLKNKYSEKPESNLVSFKKLLELNTHSQSVANLRTEAEKYRPYLAYTGAGYLYQDNIINQQLEYLKTEIENTIVIIKESK